MTFFSDVLYPFLPLDSSFNFFIIIFQFSFFTLNGLILRFSHFHYDFFLWNEFKFKRIDAHASKLFVEIFLRNSFKNQEERVIEILWELDHINALISLRSLMLRCCRPPRDSDVIIFCSHSTLSFYLMQELFSIYFVYLQPVKSEIFRYNLEKKVNKHVCKINIFPSTPENRPTLCLHNNISACDLISFSLLLFIYVFKLQFIVL